MAQKQEREWDQPQTSELEDPDIKGFNKTLAHGLATQEADALIGKILRLAKEASQAGRFHVVIPFDSAVTADAGTREHIRTDMSRRSFSGVIHKHFIYLSWGGSPKTPGVRTLENL